MTSNMTVLNCMLSGKPDKGNRLMTYARIAPLAILDHSFPAWQTFLVCAHCTGSYVASFETRTINGHVYNI